MDEKERLSTSDIASSGEGEQVEYPEGQEPQSRPQSATAMAHTEEGARPTPLFNPDDAQSLRSHWDEVQAGFVDDPRRAVQDADSLVAEVIKRLADTFAEERSKMEQQWGSGENVSTEDLRMALRRYRSFFDRLLSI